MARGLGGSSEGDEVARLLGRQPRAAFSVVVRDGEGKPVVIKNAPFLDDGTPMPTLYWLVGPAECDAVSVLEAAGGVHQAEEELPADEIVDAHRRYALEREASISSDRRGPRPSGGVGGTARGVKCLHAHLAWYLAGGDDPVGKWTAWKIGASRDVYTKIEMTS